MTTNFDQQKNEFNLQMHHKRNGEEKEKTAMALKVQR